MKVFINVETEGKNNEELTTELVMVKSFVVKKITDMFPSVKADKDIEFVSSMRSSGRENDRKHIHLEDHARLLLVLADCDILVDAPHTDYRRRNGSNAIANAAAIFGIPIVELGLNDYSNPGKGMHVDTVNYYDTKRRAPRPRNVTYSRYDREEIYEEEE